MNLKAYLVRSQSAEAGRLTGFGKSVRAERSANGLLPPTFSLGGRASAFFAHELEAVSNLRAQGGNDEEVRKLVEGIVALRAQGSTPEATYKLVEEIVALRDQNPRTA